MDPVSVFIGETGALKSELTAQNAWLQNLAAGNGRYKAFAAKVVNDTKKLMAELVELTNNPQEGGKLRHDKLIKASDRAANLLGEILMLRTIDSARAVAPELCVIGDRLLDDIGNATGLRIPLLTTVAESEFFGVASRIIRLRFPAASLWDVCILAHEYGHAFGPLWNAPDSVVQYPRHSFIKRHTLGSPEVMDEYFCDLLAVFLLGPAYVCTCMLTRFNPQRESETHPADVNRAWWVLNGLERLADVSQEYTQQPYRNIAATLRKFWGASCDQSLPAPQKDPELLNAEMEFLFPLMMENLPAAAFTSFDRAWGLSADFEQNVDVTTNRARIRDLLNAIWLVRMEQPGKTEAVHSWAMRQIGRFLQ